MTDKETRKTNSIISFLQKYLKVNLSYIIKGGFWMTIGQLSASLSSLIIVLAFARFAAPEVYGNYKYITAIGTTLGAFTLTGASVAYAREVARGNKNSLMDMFFKTLLWSTPSIVAGFGASIYYYFLNNDIYFSAVIVFISLLSPISCAFLLYGAYLYGSKNFKFNNILFAASNIASAIVLVISMFLTSSPGLLASIYLFSTALFQGVCFLIVRNQAREEANTKNIESETLHFAKHLSVMNILSIIATQADKILVFHAAGAAQLAIYTLASAIPSQINGLLKIIAKLAFPKFAEQDLKFIKHNINGKILRFAIMILIIIVAYTLLAPIIFTYILPKYISSIEYSQIIAIGLLATVGLLPNSALQAHAKTKELYWISITNSLTLIGIDMLLIIPFGIWGAIYAFLANKIIAFLINYILLIHSVKNTQ